MTNSKLPVIVGSLLLAACETTQKLPQEIIDICKPEIEAVSTCFDNALKKLPTTMPY